jgi:hypothetical protein
MAMPFWLERTEAAGVVVSELARMYCAMYIHRMVRTQLYLDEAIHRRLSGLARKQGRTLSELVRDALVRIYGPPGADERRASLHAIEGLWRNRTDIADTAEYVRRLRRDTRRRRDPTA